MVKTKNQMPVEFAEQVAKKLNIPLEYGHAFHITVNSRFILIFGYANDSLGYNFVTSDGFLTASGELSDHVQIQGQNVEMQATYIAQICCEYGVDLSQIN